MLPILPNSATITQAHQTARQKGEGTATTLKSWGACLFIIAGLILLATQLVPLGNSYIKGVILQDVSGSIFVPVPQAFLQGFLTTRYVDPGAVYFESLIKAALIESDEPDLTYQSPMQISILSAKIVDVLLSPNVSGALKNIYEPALKKGVAHLKGTPLPGQKGTTIIYGHSGLTGIFTSPNNPQLIFSRLDAVQVGDTMTIHKDGKELDYLITAKKIVAPEDLTFLTGPTTKERAILVTCWPLGVGTKRLIVIAERNHE